MLLRRIIEHVKAQNWTAVWLDFFIVVMGVFIGLQANVWNEARINRQLEKSYIERLHKDAIDAIIAQRGNMDWDEERISAQQVVLDTLRSGALAEEQVSEFNFGLAFVGMHNSLRWQWGTVEELKSTGNIDLISNEELRKLLAVTESEYDRWTKLINISEAQIAATRPLIVDQFDVITPGFDDSEKSEINYDFEALSTDREFIAALSNIQVNSGVIRLSTKEHLRNLTDLEAGIAKARGVPSLPREDVMNKQN